MKIKIRLVSQYSSRTEIIEDDEPDIFVAKIVGLLIEWGEVKNATYKVSEIKE